MKNIDLNNFVKIIISIVIFSVVIITFLSVDSLNDKNILSEEKKIEEIIEKALVQCYSLEGSYPSDIMYLEKYGVIFNTDKYFYYYEPMGNFLPDIKIIRIDGKDIVNEVDYFEPQ